MLGAGAREHALARAFARSPSVGEVIVAPGNAGMAEARPGLAPVRCSVPTAGPAPASAAELARREQADLVVIGPGAPLVAGAVDALEAAGVVVFGPSRDAAMLEGSEAFVKRFATRYGIPTAPYVIATSFAEADAAIRRRGAPIVVKVDGGCGGEGVVVAGTVPEALHAAHEMLVDRRFGDAGATVVIEDLVSGVEAGVPAVSDGERMLILPPVRRYERAGDGGTGPATSGMGAFAPAEGDAWTPELLKRIERTILRPTIEGMASEGRPFRGVLFARLVLTPAGEPLLLRHDVSFGDPECEALMALLDGDPAALFRSVARGSLEPSTVAIPPNRHALSLVLAASGYPGAPRTGDVIEDVERAENIEGVSVYHDSTATRAGALVTTGGRVLVLTATGTSLLEARARAYRAAGVIRYEGMFFRGDIGAARA